MKLVADLHCHTVASGDAYSTVKEMVQGAADKGLELIAITDHGPSMPGGPHLYHFGNFAVIPNQMFGVQVLKGVESNIIDHDGNIDMPERYLKKLDIVLAGFHNYCYPGGSIEENTRAMINAMKHPYIDIIVHPGNPDYPINIEQVVKAAKDLQVFIEINNSSFSVSRRGSEKNCYEIAKMVKKHNVMISVGSDAHIFLDVGNFVNALEVIKNVGLAKKNVLNTSVSSIKQYLARKTNTQASKQKLFPTN